MIVSITLVASAAEFHVATTGNDAASGTAAAPLRTIQRAADLAHAGDVITVHEGVYRQRINPPRGGESDDKRIVYQAAPGERVEIHALGGFDSTAVDMRCVLIVGARHTRIVPRAHGRPFVYTPRGYARVREMPS